MPIIPAIDDLEFIPDPSGQTLHYWYIENTSNGAARLFAHFRNQPTGARELYPVWLALGDGVSTLNPMLLDDDTIGEILGEIRAMGFPDVRPVLAYTVR